MKQKNLLTTMLLLFALIVGSTSAWADTDVVFTFTQDQESYGWNGTPANQTDLSVGDVFTNGSVTFTYTNKGSGNTNLRWWSTGDGLRSYKGNKFKIATSTGTIEKITITGTCMLAESTSTGGTIANNRNWTKPEAGGITEVEFECNQSSGNKTIKTITVTIAPPASSDPSSSVSFEDESPSIDFKDNKTYTQNATAAEGYNTNLITYTITENTAGATISGSTVTIAYEGSVTVKATAPAVTGSFAESSATYTLTVTDSRTVANISWSSDADVNIEQGAADGDYTLLTLINPDNLAVTYTITGTDDLAVEVDGTIMVDTDILGSVTVTASYTGSDYKPNSVSYKISVYDPNVKGTAANPYSVAEVIAMNPTSTSEAVVSGCYVKGFIIGAVDGSNGNLKSVSESNSVDTNLAIADTPDETTNYCTVQLPSGDIRNALKTKNQTYNIGIAQILVKGNIKKYCGKPGVKDLTEGSKIAEKVSITAAGMATYYTDCALDFTNFTDMYAYTATVNGDAITFNRVRKVPANTGVLLRNPNGKVATSQLVPVTDTPENVTSVLVGTLEDIDALASVDGNYVNYILNNGSQGVGFYKANDQSLGTHKAYLHVTAQAARAFIGFSEDETTGISNVNCETIANGRFYNLAGQSVANPTKGLYIVNGKKVAVK